VPHDLGGATVVHGRGPDGEDSVLGVEGAVSEEGGVLGHTVGEGDIVILAPSTEGMEEEDGVSVTLSDELLTGILKEKDVTIMEGVSDLEGVDDISVLLDNLGLDLSGGQSVLVVAVVEDGSGGEGHGLTRDEEVSLGEDSLGLGVLSGHAAEGTGADLFLSVVVDDGLVDDSKDGVITKLGAGEGNAVLTFEFGLLLSSDILSDGDGKKVLLALGVSEGLHVHDLEELELVHELVKGSGEAITDGLEVLDLMLVDVKLLEASEFGGVLGGRSGPVGGGDCALGVALENTLSHHVVDALSLALLKGEGTSVDVHGWVLGGLVRGGDTSEVGDDTGTGLSIKSLDITALANFEGSADMALVELEASSFVGSLGEVSVLGVR